MTAVLLTLVCVLAARDLLLALLAVLAARAGNLTVSLRRKPATKETPK